MRLILSVTLRFPENSIGGEKNYQDEAGKLHSSRTATLSCVTRSALTAVSVAAVCSYFIHDARELEKTF